MDEQTIITEYLSGKSENDLAKKFNTTRYYISQLLNKNNINKHESDIKKHSVLQNISYDEFLDMYTNNNMSYKEIADKYNATERQIKRLNTTKFHCKKLSTDILANRNIGLSNYYKSEIAKDTLHASSVKRKNTVKEKYGVDNVFQLESVKAKIKETNINKYNVENPSQNEVVKEKISESLKTKFGTLFNRTQDEIEIVNDKEKLLSVIQSLDTPSLYNLALATKYSVSYLAAKVREFGLEDYIKYQTTTSHYEDEIVNYLNTLGITNIIRNSRILNSQEIDIYIPDKKVGIEFNGDYWHTDDIVGNKYHFNKSLCAEKLGIRLIHIYEYQWVDQVKQNILKSIIRNALGLNENKIYARKCVIKELSCLDVIDFSNNNSLHMHRNAKIYLGLFYNNELVELMSFGHPFFANNKNIDYECIRSITKIGYTVIGGMNKLLSYFIQKYKPKNILYYVDFNTHNGNSMEKLNFKFVSYSGGGKINIARSKDVEANYGYVFGRNPMQNKEIKQLIKDNKIKTITDSGVKKYLWQNLNQ